MFWPVRAVGWALWVVSPAEPPCDGTGRHVARQQLGGPPAGVASADVSADGRIVAFVSMARLSDLDVNAVEDVYTIDRTTGAIRLESVTAAGLAGNGSSHQPRISADGRVLVFPSVATNLIGARVEAVGGQVLRRDRVTGATTLVSRTTARTPGNGWSGHPDVSDDGRYVVFESRATDLVAGGDANRGGSDIYLFDADDGSVRRISLTDQGVQSASGQSATPAISGSGRAVTFTSTAPIDAPARARLDDPVRSVYRRDLITGETRRISATPRGGVPDGASAYPAISRDGRRIAFVSVAADLDPASRPRHQQHVYVYDEGAGRIRLLSRGGSGRAADAPSRHPALSADGRFAAFSSDASDLPCPGRCGPLGDLNLVSDVYRADIDSGVVERVSGGAPAREPWWHPSGGPALDATGAIVVFSSRQPIDDADLEDDDDLFVAVQPHLAGTAAGHPCHPQPGRR